ncbi:bifunctional pyr operon transcriptional regulator/uracil phosphoribosyltransferase PyrR [Plasticicumulans sp.]|uniref:bifunctional pyr operon transcriptional regulator/uracil phosphoribosyltransferase PyrR n=1 Tax=Plasticicumulans sp. TaxID=2307179 RepID=UPI000FBEFBE6|nr:bifunctional pyr operon transcriptional regulator/uracil phosphoribosyltransferase PyrR [Plasticicumulans sp.]MBS0601541.1 bifunctional pyr operon transcriptional regulator/uracil phosphoribosyltransferase PyrR [Pseudomonadota bacterium]RTL03674.1 MAG: bifunctional pyr operon transcriptional regulator/uracil phosphoribosyltransferase PyrR [Xanthomonadales bacterium]HMW29306.1 bifunctional pyr operon transcriptional regulator/uracil phosphoribosyltransferase PyrR [Plasticicumulans sp.]HMW4365
MQLDAERLIDTLASGLRAHLARRGIGTPLLFGIRTGGVGLAERLRVALGVAEPIGTLDISFHRDDDVRDGLDPQVRPSRIPVDPEGRDLVLVDDVLYTGRTVRAALNELFDYGRPRSVTLAVLVDRGGRELPIQADVVAELVTAAPGERVELRWPGG